jgi:hypothetical protein
MAHLIYAKGNEDPAHVVRQSGIEIFCHAIDLSLKPDELIGRIHDLAATLASTTPGAAGEAEESQVSSSEGRIYRG